MASLADVAANNVRAERARRRWTQAELARRLDWPRTSIHDVEIGRRRLGLDDLAAVCRVFGIDLLDLCHGGDDDDLRALGLTRR